MEENIEYIDKSVLTKKQKNEIENSIDKFINELNQNFKFIAILCCIFFMLVMIVGYITEGFDKEMLIFFLLLYTCSFFCCYFYFKCKREYVIIRANVINKRVSKYKGRVTSYIVKVKDKNKKRKFLVSGDDVYSSIKINEQGIYVVCKKQKNKLSGTIVLNITDMIE